MTKHKLRCQLVPPIPKSQEAVTSDLGDRVGVQWSGSQRVNNIYAVDEIGFYDYLMLSLLFDEYCIFLRGECMYNICVFFSRASCHTTYKSA